MFFDGNNSLQFMNSPWVFFLAKKSTMNDQVYNGSFHQDILKVKFNAVLAKTSAIRVTSREKIY